LTKDLPSRRGSAENLYAIAYTDKNPKKQSGGSGAAPPIRRRDPGDSEKLRIGRNFHRRPAEDLQRQAGAAEKAMTDFRRGNMGLMFGDRRDYYTRLVEAQTALDGADP